MISSTELESKAEELGVHLANVQRDYVFGWLLAGMYDTDNTLGSTLALKGGNAFRKAYFERARYSNDLDFSAQTEIDPDELREGLLRACESAAERSGIHFLLSDTRVSAVSSAVGDSSRYEARVYFKSFLGDENLRIKVELDVKEFDRVFLPIQARQLIHSYSDYEACSATMRCHKLEELLAAKLKALLQRQHSPDLYDFVHAVFFQDTFEVSRREIITTFLKKTIYEPNPGLAKGLFLELPFQVIKGLWEEYLVCPRDSFIAFEDAVERFTAVIEDLFALVGPPRPAPAFAGAAVSAYGASARGTILEAGRLRRLLRLTYKGVTREVEPYSLVYKRRKDGVAREYFYVWDRTGGRSSGPGIKSLFPESVSGIQLTDTSFEPRYPIELAGGGSGYFAQPFTTRPSAPRASRRTRSSTGTTYTVQCPVCGKQFKRSTRDTRLREHKDKYGNRCFGRTGFPVW